MLMLPSSVPGDQTLGTTGFEDGAGAGRLVRELWRLQARQDQSLKQDKASRMDRRGQRRTQAERHFGGGPPGGCPGGCGA